MAWDALNVIGTIAFAISGALVAMEEEYDILGVYILSLVTAFGGGAIRNLLIGVPISDLWKQEPLFLTAIAVTTVLFWFPDLLLKHWNRWGTFTDAIGLSAFAIQGALYATSMGHPLSASIVAALLTGSGGGVIRDILAGRKPLLLKAEIYGVWAMTAGLLVGLHIATTTMDLFVLFIAVVILRMLSVHFNWRLPYRKIKQLGEQ